MKSKTPHCFRKLIPPEGDFVKRTSAVGLAAVSVPLLLGCWSQLAIAALAIEHINATMVWHSSVVRLPIKPGYVQVEISCERVVPTFA